MRPDSKPEPATEDEFSHNQFVDTGAEEGEEEEDDNINHSGNDDENDNDNEESDEGKRLDGGLESELSGGHKDINGFSESDNEAGDNIALEAPEVNNTDNETEHAIDNVGTSRPESTRESSVSKLDYILNYKKRNLQVDKDSGEPPVKKSVLRQSSPPQSSFSAGTKGGSDSLLYNLAPINESRSEEGLQDSEAQYLAGERPGFTEDDFKHLHKIKEALHRLRDLEQKEQIVKLLAPKEFRFKMFLEDYLARLVSSTRLLRFSKLDLRQLQHEYRRQYLRHQKYTAVQKKLERYRVRVQRVQRQRFEVVPWAPGATPWHQGRKYLTMNTVGVVWIETKTSRPMVTVNVYDKSIRNDHWFNVGAVYDVACLGSRGMVLAVSGYCVPGDNDVDDEGMAKLQRYVPMMYRSHDRTVSFESSVELLRDEYVVCVSCGGDTINIYLSTGVVRKYSASTGLLAGTEKTFPTVCSIGNGDSFFDITVKDPYNCEFLYSLQDAATSEYMVRNAPLNISLRSAIGNANRPLFSHCLSTFDILRGLFFDDGGRPCYVDNNEYLCVLPHPRGEFVPVLNLVEAFNRFNHAHNNLVYFPLGAANGAVQVVIVKDAVLDKKLALVHGKIAQAEKEIRQIQLEVREKERQEKLEMRNRRGKDAITDVLQPDADPSSANASQPKTESQKLQDSYAAKLAKNKAIINDTAGFVMKAEFRKDVFAEAAYNYPWFPLPGLSSFALCVPLDTAQPWRRNTRFNDPSLDTAATMEGDLFSRGTDSELSDQNKQILGSLGLTDDIDALFDAAAMDYDSTAEKGTRYNSVISAPEHDAALANSLFLMDSLRGRQVSSFRAQPGGEGRSKGASDEHLEHRHALVKLQLQHDATVLRVFNELVVAKKYKLAFISVKQLRLKQSYKAVFKICEANGVGRKLGRAVQYWRDRKATRFGELLEEA